MTYLPYKWPPVKVDQIYNLEILLFSPGLAYTPISCTIVFNLPYHFKERTTKKGLMARYFKTPFRVQNGNTTPTTIVAREVM